MFVGLSDVYGQRTLGEPVFRERPPARSRGVIGPAGRAWSWGRVLGGRHRSWHPASRAPHATANAPPRASQQPPSGRELL